jgi:ribosomal protein L3
MLKGLLGKKIGMTQIFDDKVWLMLSPSSKLGLAMLPRLGVREGRLLCGAVGFWQKFIPSV